MATEKELPGVRYYWDTLLSLLLMSILNLTATREAVGEGFEPATILRGI